jgi:hypothetical protein
VVVRHTHNIARANPFRGRIADVLRKYADRIDHAGAPKATHVRFTYEDRVGMVFRDDGRGCRLWYLGDADHERAHTEAGPVVGARSTAWLPQRNATVVPPAGPVFEFSFSLPPSERGGSGLSRRREELAEQHAEELAIREAERLAAIRRAAETGEYR